MKTFYDLWMLLENTQDLVMLDDEEGDEKHPTNQTIFPGQMKAPMSKWQMFKKAMAVPQKMLSKIPSNMSDLVPLEDDDLIIPELPRVEPEKTQIGYKR